MANIMRIIGLSLSMIVLVVMGFILNLLDGLTRLIVQGIETLFGSELEHRRGNGQRVHNEPVYEIPNDIIDVNASLKKTNFPFTPEELIAKMKVFCSRECAFGSKTPEMLSDDFQFVFPVVGPLTKEEYCTAFNNFKFYDAFPNAKNNFFGFTVDPMEPNRVWCFLRSVLKHDGTLQFGASKYPASGKTIIHTPQAYSACFDEEGRVFKITGGYPIDRTIGNTGGLGGLFGVVHAVGGSLPFPEGKPWKPSLQWEAWSKRFPQIGKEWRKE